MVSADVTDHRTGILRCFILLLLISNTSLWSGKSAAEISPYIKMSTETPRVFVGDLIILDIEYVGLVEEPDFSLLKSAAPFERETYGTRIGVFGGKVIEIKIRRMEFVADKAGPLILGPLTSRNTIDGEQTPLDVITSNSVTIKVQAASKTIWTVSAADAVLTTTLSPSNPYVHQQLTLDITLQHQHQIAEEQFKLPSLNDFKVVPVFSERRTVDASNGMRTTAWRYLIFPKFSGVIDLGEVSWSGTLVKSRTERAAFKRSSGVGSIAVLPAIESGSIHGEWWLPASSLELTESWSSDLKQLKAGSESIRTLSVIATGVTASQLPVITPLETRGLTQSLIDQKRSENMVAGTITSTASFQYRVKAQSPIPVFLDTVRVAWWNTRTNKAAEAIIPARRINIGLPERDDLLAELARDNSGSLFLASPVFRKILSYGWLRIASASVILLTVAILTLRLLKMLTNKLNSHFKKRQFRSTIIGLAEKEQWNDLYKMLCLHAEHPAKKSVVLNNSQLREVMADLGKFLFSNPPASSINKPPDISKINSLACSATTQQTGSSYQQKVLPSI